MRIIYLSRCFQPRTVSTPAPGDIYPDPAWGDCKRLTASRFCLAAERLGTDSDAFTGILEALEGAAVNDEYDGRHLDGWRGLVGLPPMERGLREIICPECRTVHFALHERGRPWNGGVCCRCEGENLCIA
jgi:hypothetical protein